MDHKLKESDFTVIDLNPRDENILAPNGNHHPSPSPHSVPQPL